MEPRIARYGNLVALPFNAAASTAQQIQGCPAPDDLWQQTRHMMMLEEKDLPREHHTSSYCHFLYGRFVMDGWNHARLADERTAFLQHETAHKIPFSNGQHRLNNGFLIVDTERMQVVGERRTGHISTEPQTATGMDVVHPQMRGQKLSYAFFELGCLLAREMGYPAYEANISKGNSRSYKRLDAMVAEGRATRLSDDWLEHRNYRIDLNAFTPRAI